MVRADNFLSFINSVTPQWIAGFFDGEGSVSSSFDNYGNVKLRVEISQKNEYILLLIMAKFSNGTFKRAKLTNASGKVYYHYRVHWDGKLAIPLLEAIKDFTIVKHELVVNALKLAYLFQDDNRKLLDIERRDREIFKDRISTINQANRDLNIVQ